MLRHTLLAGFALILLAACGDGRQGIVISSDGSVADNSPERAKARAEELITRDLESFRATVAVLQLPRWQTESRARAEGWYWDMVKVEVTVPAAVTERQREEITTVARNRLDGAVIGGSEAILVAVAVATPPVASPVPVVAAAAVPAAAAAPAPAPAPAAAAAVPVTPGARHYTVQDGDTLGDISVVFYGSAQHWRVILAANPGLDPTKMVAGTELVIPPKR